MINDSVGLDNYEFEGISKVVSDNYKVGKIVNQRHLLVEKFSGDETDQSETTTSVWSPRKGNIHYRLENIAKISQNQVESVSRELSQQDQAELIPFLFKCDPSRDGNKGINSENNCQTQLELNVVNSVNVNIVNVQSDYQAKIPVLQYDPSKEGLPGSPRNKNKTRLPSLTSTAAIDRVYCDSTASLGAIPKRQVMKRKPSIEVRKEKTSELETLFSKMRSKNASNLNKKSPKKYAENCDIMKKKTQKCSPTKLLSKYNRSPRNIMKELKSKLEGNRVKNMVKKFAIGQIPSSPKVGQEKGIWSSEKVRQESYPI